MRERSVSCKVAGCSDESDCAAGQLGERWSKCVAGFQNHTAFNEILQLANVSRPAMGDKYIHHCGGNSIDVFAHAYCISRRKVSYQQRNVLGPIPQRRDGCRKNDEAIVEIAAKPFL